MKEMDILLFGKNGIDVEMSNNDSCYQESRILFKNANNMYRKLNMFYFIFIISNVFLKICLILIIIKKKKCLSLAFPI